MPKGEKAFISLRLPCGKSFYFFDMTAPGDTNWLAGMQQSWLLACLWSGWLVAMGSCCIRGCLDMFNGSSGTVPAGLTGLGS